MICCPGCGAPTDGRRLCSQCWARRLQDVAERLEQLNQPPMSTTPTTKDNTE
jgi:hypothetical protein